jgi:hypothetical protein|tara:strand:+ start:3439 stop:3837 length:399 start_codon:yes stop_codon:yes gene_type:complete
MTLAQKIFKSDIIGASSSGFCIIHCAVTPILFLANLSTASCCNTIPAWWQLLNYLFLTVSFIAVISAVKKSTKAWLRIALISSWALLFLAILIETFEIVIIPEVWNYIPALSLIALHLYNKNYCLCDDCCEN